MKFATLALKPTLSIWQRIWTKLSWPSAFVRTTTTFAKSTRAAAKCSSSPLLSNYSGKGTFLNPNPSIVTSGNGKITVSTNTTPITLNAAANTRTVTHSTWTNSNAVLTKPSDQLTLVLWIWISNFLKINFLWWKFKLSINWHKPSDPQNSRSF